MIKVIIKKILMIVAALVAVCSLLVADVWYEVHIPKINPVSVYSSKVSSGSPVKVVQISDVHGSPISSHKTLIGKISDFKPRVILLTGDVIDRSTKDFSGVYQDIEVLRKISPVVFITGNHELANPLGESFVSGLRDIGVFVLRNSSMTFGDDLRVAGVEDIHFGGDDIPRALREVTPKTFNILLSHTPTVAPRMDKGSDIDLILSGHTHGGQVRLPFFGAVFLPDNGIDGRLIKGLVVLDNGMMVYTDSGFGTSVIPVRFMDQSQISFITVSNSEK